MKWQCGRLKAEITWTVVTTTRRRSYLLRLTSGEVVPENLTNDCELRFVAIDPVEDILDNSSAGFSIPSRTNTRVKASKLRNVIKWPTPPLDRARR
jgi:hypothetical protein